MAITSYSGTANDAQGDSRTFPIMKEENFPVHNEYFGTAQYVVKPMQDELLGLIKNSAPVNYTRTFTCPSNLAVGDPVYISGVNTVAYATAASATTSQVVGFVKTKPTSTTCTIAQDYYWSGASGFSGFSGVQGNQSYSGYGQPVYLSTSGYSGQPSTSYKVLGESISPREALLRADPFTAISAPLAGYRNKIINGAMNVYQRGTASGNAFALDRFYLEVAVSSATFTQTQSQDVPTFTQSGSNFYNSWKIDCTGADTSVTATKAIDIIYKIEGYDWQDCNGKPLVISFWVKSTKTGTFGWSLANNGADRNFVTDYVVHATNTWERKVIYIPPNPNGGTWLYTNGCGAALRWGLLAGSNYTVGNGWNTSNPRVLSSNQVNAADSASNDFYLTGVQLEVGTNPTPFEHKPFQQELALCQRYYEKSYEYPTVPGTGSASYYDVVCVPASCIANTKYTSIPFRVQKRAVGGTTRIWSYTGASGQVSDNDGTNMGAGSGTLLNAGDRSLFIYNGFGTFAAAKACIIFQWDVSAEL